MLLTVAFSDIIETKIFPEADVGGVCSRPEVADDSFPVTT